MRPLAPVVALQMSVGDSREVEMLEEGSGEGGCTALRAGVLGLGGACWRPRPPGALRAAAWAVAYAAGWMGAISSGC